MRCGVAPSVSLLPFEPGLLSALPLPLPGGVAYLDYIRQLAQRLEGDWEGVQADLEAIR